MRKSVILAALLFAACDSKVDAKVKIEQKQAEREPPRMSDDERLAKCRKRGEEFFSAMGLMSSPSCYISKDDSVVCQLPEASKRKVHIIDCNADGCNYQGGKDY